MLNLPPVFPSGPFAVADAVDLGISPSRLRDRSLARPFHGVRTHPSARDDGAENASKEDRISILQSISLGLARDYVPLLRPGDRFSSRTAASLLGIPVPSSLEEFARTKLDVTAGPGLERPRGRRIAGHDDDGRSSVSFAGLPISSPATLVVELASLLHRPRLVAVVDDLVREPRIVDVSRPRPLVGLPSLRSELARTRRRHGIVRARDAAVLARVGAESPKETELRLLLLDAGIPEPELQYELWSARGHRIGWFDFAWPQRRVLCEYDGDHHRLSTAQYERDIRRFDEAAEDGWAVVRVRKYGLGPGRAETVVRVRRALG